MKSFKMFVMGGIVSALLFGAGSASAMPPPPPPGVQLMPGMVWCHRCGGHGRVPSGFLGWNDKRCPECKGRGMLMVRTMPPPPPPPPVVHHHGKHHHVEPVRPMPPPQQPRHGRR